ncbi:hypothetical protein GB937_001342 [Aspergillus fischeri]|nr:hypothetical protein GB937_001342 [Aspergillus fischeri]
MLPWATALNHNLTIAVATLYINFSVYFTSSGKILIPDSSKQGLVLISKLIKLVTSKEDLEEVYHAVVTLGTLIKVLEEAVKSATREVYNVEYILEKILTTKKGNDCISEEAPSCTDSNTRLENGQCVTTTTPSCRPTFQWDGQNCVSEGHPDCESPGTWDGQACVLPGQPTCPDPNTVPVPVNGSCIAQFRPLCQPPTVESNSVCLVDRKVNCKEGVLSLPFSKRAIRDTPTSRWSACEQAPSMTKAMKAMKAMEVFPVADGISVSVQLHTAEGELALLASPHHWSRGEKDGEVAAVKPGNAACWGLSCRMSGVLQDFHGAGRVGNVNSQMPINY